MLISSFLRRKGEIINNSVGFLLNGYRINLNFNVNTCFKVTKFRFSFDFPNYRVSEKNSRYLLSKYANEKKLVSVWKFFS